MKVAVALLLALACVSCASAALSVTTIKNGGAPDPEPKTSPPLCDTLMCNKTCCAATPKPVYATYYCNATKACAWNCLPGTIPCANSCYKVPYPNAIGWCQDNTTFKWGCKPFTMLCKGACRPYPNGSVNQKCNPATGKISFHCGMNWKHCNDKCCEPPLNAEAVCAVDSKGKRYCTFQCHKGFKKCSNKTKCCKA